jgi:hypothetical protein
MSELHKQLESSPSRVTEVVDAWYESDGHDNRQLVQAAQAIATSYVESRLPFLVANSAMTRLMIKRAWEAPEEFWSIFVAFEDLEVDEDPGEKGRAHVQAALSGVCASNHSLQARRP